MIQLTTSFQRVRSYNMKYQLLENVLLRTNEDGTISSIPLDPANADYQAYLEHEAQAK